jgi:alpha-L-rhamnosidase
MTAQNLPRPDQWVANWIEPVEPVNGPTAHRPAYHLAGEVQLAGPVASALLRVTAHGLYEAFVNGTRVGDEELRPGFTAYRHRVQFQTYDVSDLLVDGTNAIGAILSDGWWRGQHGIVRAIDAYGPTTALLAELRVALRSGEEVVLGSGADWRSTPSHIVAADLLAGEVHDLGRRVPGWSEPGTDRSGWDPVRVADHGFSELVPTVGPPVRRMEELPAVHVTEIAPARHVVDFGQNSNGWVRLHDLGPAGTKLVITHGEALDAEGDVTIANIEHAAFSEPRDVPLPFQQDVVLSAGDDTVFEPRHSTKGFRYVRIEGHPGPLSPDSVHSIVVHTDLARMGDFECSDERINRLHRVAVWTFRANACEIPTDCPTRERSGWVGDWQLYVDTAAYLFDVTEFSAKWLLDLAADQLENGAVTNIVPDPSPGAPIWKDGHGSSGWGDAAVHVPWELYRSTGRTDLLTTQFESMRRWVDFAAELAATGRHASRVQRSAEPLPHERFIWDSGWHFGEWLEPGTDMAEVFGQLLVADHGPVATTYLFRSAQELAHIAALLDEKEAATKYAELAEHVRAAWQSEFIVDGRVQPRTQATLVRALAFGLLPEELRTPTADDLAALVHEAGIHLGTGFLATPFLLPVLADHGQLDLAYDLLFQDTEPSWLAMTETGSTTVWEDWDAVKPDGSVSHSLSHYSKGAVISFLHRYVAGLQLVDPGYRRFRVAPRPGGGITSARTTHEAPTGRIDVDWVMAGGTGQLQVAVPPGTEAELLLPDGTSAILQPGDHRHEWNAPTP